jgi:hypothetical protein
MNPIARSRWAALAFVVLWAAPSRGAAPVRVPALSGAMGNLALSAPAWQAGFSSFLASPAPDFATVQASVQSLERIDTSDPKVQEALRPLAIQLQASAAALLAAPPARASESELRAASNKLRLLNTPALRNLLGDEALQSRVGAAAWAYNRALWDGTLASGAKAAAVARALEAPPAAAAAPALAPAAAVKIVDGDVMKVKADAVVASIECGGFCGSAINSALSRAVGGALKGRDLRDGRTLTVPAAEPRRGDPESFVLVVDDQKLPLHQIVLRALHEAEKSGFKSVVLPALRSGYAFGAVETTHAQVVAELAAGVARFLAEGRGSLTDITFAVPRNARLTALLRAALDGPAKTRERSLREDLREAVLSGRGFEMAPSASPAPVDAAKSPVYREMLKPWDLAHMMENHAPVRIGTLEDRAAFSRPTVSVLNMPIKMPGTGYRVPEELAQFREFIQKMIDHEAAVNPRADEFYAYITVDQHLVKKGATHRKGGIHIDGVQGARYPVKLPPEHTYSASDAVGTVFYAQPFDLRGLDPARQHVHAELERQARPESRVTAQDYGLYFWDSYSAHEAGTAGRDTVRTFVRIEYSKKVYDGLGDTQSPLFDYHWPRVPRPIPAALDDRPLASPAAEVEIDARGYPAEFAGMKAWAPHTVKDLRGYLTDNLGAETVRAARAGKASFLIAVGESAEALARARALGWSVGERVAKKEGFHQVFAARDPEGRPGFVIARVNGADRVLHLQSLLKLAGAPAEKVRAAGRTRSWRAEYRRAFEKLGYVPDLVVYGFANTTIDSTLLRNAFKNGRHFATLSRLYKKKTAAVAGDSASDLDGLDMQVLELADGRRIWFLHCMFGDLARDLVGAAADIGAKNITFIGSAGSLDPKTRFGSVVTPAARLRADGVKEDLDLPEIPGIPRAGVYRRVPTPNVGTRAWTRKARAEGVDLVESELGRVLDELRARPGVRLRVALVISEVASGPNRRDMTQWGLSDLRALIPDLRRVMDASLDAKDADFIVKSYKSVPLAPARR